MNKKIFLKRLNYELRKLSKENRKLELNKYQNLDNYNLNPKEEANKIYKLYDIEENISFFDAINTIIDVFSSKDKKKINNIFGFSLYIFLLIIFIKLPFIYVRDMILNIFNNLFTKDIIFVLWNLLFELLYAFAAIIVFIRLIKNKAKE